MMRELLPIWIPQLLIAAAQTAELTLLSFAVALAGGIVLVAARMSHIKVLGSAARGYITVMRGTPVLAQLFFIYFGLAEFGLTLTSYQAAIIGLGANSAAYVAEIYRAGIESVSRGQVEAARAIGLRRPQVMRYVVIPQTFTVILPPLANQAIALLKETSVASLIAAPELMMRAKELAAEYYMPLELYVISGLMYFCLAFPLSVAVRSLERRWSVRSSPFYC